MRETGLVFCFCFTVRIRLCKRIDLQKNRFGHEKQVRDESCYVPRRNGILYLDLGDERIFQKKVETVIGTANCFENRLTVVYRVNKLSLLSKDIKQS